MGTSASKASRVAGSAARKYPTSAPVAAPNTLSGASNSAAAAAPSSAPASSPAGPQLKPHPHAASTRDEAVNLDASDPDFARSLRSLGPVQPNPTLSPTSAFSPANAAAAPDPRANPAIAVLDARARIRQAAEREFEAGGRGPGGREFLDVYTIRQILALRDERGKPAAEIERALGLKAGVVARLGGAGVLGLAREAEERGRGRVEMV